MTQEIMKGFADAWLQGDLEKIMGFFTEDCFYFPSVLLKQKSCFEGKEEVKAAIERMIKLDNILDAKIENLVIRGNFGFWEWRYKVQDKEDILGCDVFEFQNRLIKKKNAFRKI